MTRKILLHPDKIAEMVLPWPGVYILYKSKDGAPKYVGSASRLYDRLKSWTTDTGKAKYGGFKYFSFELTDDATEAREKEKFLINKYKGTILNATSLSNRILTQEKTATSIRDAIIKVLQKSKKETTLQEIYSGIRKFYKVSNYQNTIDKRYNQPRIQIWIRSIISKLVKDGIVKKVGRGVYKIR